MSKWKKILKGIAPTLATALGGPLAGMATKVISEKLLGKDDGGDSEIYEALMNPEGLAKLKEIEADFKTKMKSMDVDLERMAVDDRKSARSLATNTSLLPQTVITGVFVVGFFVLLWVLIFSNVELDESVKMGVSMLLGVVGTNVTLAMKFWFGGGPHDGQNHENMYRSIPGERLRK